MSPTSFGSPLRRQRRGSLYVSVVMVGAMVSILGMSAVLVGRINSRAHKGLADSTMARLNAQSALRLGMLMIENDPDWRFSHTTDEWMTDVSFGDGTFSLSVTDPSDNDLTDASADPVVLTGIGKKGEAVQRLEITLAPLYRGYDCLQSAIHVGDDLKFRNATVTADHILTANDDVTATASSVSADVEAVDRLTGSDYYGSTSSDGEARTLPSTADIIDFYETNGTAIDASTLPTSYANIILNSDFETGHIPWFGASSTIAQDLSHSYEGDACLLVSERIDAACGASYDVTSLVKSGASYQVRFAVQQTTKMESYYVHLQIETTFGPGLTTAGPFTPTALDTWQTGNLYVTPSWSGDLSSAKLTITTSNTSPEFAGYGGTGDSGDDFYLDSVGMHQTGREITLEHVLLSPDSNPFGATNPRGIYVIDLQGSRIIIRNCRIYGTLVLIDPRNGSRIGDGFGVSIEPAVSHFPSLVVTGGDVDIGPSDRGLIERALGVNLNPDDAPLYPVGSDDDLDDTFSSGIKGLMFSSHDFRFRSHNSIEGVILSHQDVDIRDTFDLKYDSRYYRNPPPGFSGPEEIRLLLGSARRVTE
ncbi:MAG: hypothetical protein GY826_19590 [Fuerstiella sp.]|nr:hypothetical protein [Fuerstiella sp.]